MNKEFTPRGCNFDLPLQEATKPNPVFPIRSKRSAFRYQGVENINRRTAEQGTAEYRSEKIIVLFLSKTSAVGNSLFHIRYSKNKVIEGILVPIFSYSFEDVV